MAEQTPYDAIVIGGGHNGLVAAAYLSKAGYKTLVLEKRSILGGAAASEEIFPGFQVNTGSLEVGMFLPVIVKDLSLTQHGLKFIESPAIVTALQPDGLPLTLWRDAQRSQLEIAHYNQADAARFPAYLRWISQLTGILQDMLTLTPPPIPHLSAGELLPWLSPALKARRLGRREVMEFVRLLPMPVSDFLDEWFSLPLLKAALGAPAVAGSLAGPRASGTAFMLLYQALNAGQAGFRASRFVRGGSGQLSQALAGAVRSNGGEIRTASAVTGLSWDGDQVKGVQLEDGERISSRVVLSSADPRQTFFSLVGADRLEVSFVREVKNIRFRGSTARVNLALDGLPLFPSLTNDSEADQRSRLSGHILLCQDLDALERAYDDAKYGSISGQPVLDCVLPTILDDSLAPGGKHILSINVQYTPYRLKEGDWEGHRELLLERVLETLSAYAPGIRQQVIHSQVLTPLDLEMTYNLPAGDIYHGQMVLDQLLFMRPVPGFGQYKTPIQNLYLCGAGAHPGGGVTGAPGYNAARVVIKHL